VEKIEIQPDGRIEQWPEGFFDQMDLDFNRLFGV
jgi:predicted ATPase